jgi:hypothetical protein
MEIVWIYSTLDLVMRILFPYTVEWISIFPHGFHAVKLEWMFPLLCYFDFCIKYYKQQ